MNEPIGGSFMNSLAITISAGMYRNILKPFFFRFDPEFVHDTVTTFGETMGAIPAVRNIIGSFYSESHKLLKQNLAGIDFLTPIGLAAGFDYEAKLTQITSALGFGFHTVGTITNHPYEGNKVPRLGRLIKSKSLMVNKGFKNQGAKAVIQKLNIKTFPIPLGISIGRTNSAELSQLQSVRDIIGAFQLFEESNVKHSYYELNISCPNLKGAVTFYTSQNLKQLLKEIDALRIKRPIFVKMPIEKTDKEIVDLLDIISEYKPSGVIFGNLQKNRKHPSLIKEEVDRFQSGNFSGKPTFVRSNELIKMAYTHFHDRFTIIGCGGVFSAEDAWEKITLGASLVQLITGMIFNGPQLVSKINNDLDIKLQKLGVSNISEVVGSANK